jgi:rRNA-processing protein FCF1
VRPLVIVDAENVRRSAWPNASRRELLERARRWAGREGLDLLVVFDGHAPEDAPDVAGAPDADDAIARLAAGSDRDYWLVTSDRGLRARAGARAARVIGGGTFLRSI